MCPPIIDDCLSASTEATLLTNHSQTVIVHGEGANAGPFLQHTGLSVLKICLRIPSGAGQTVFGTGLQSEILSTQSQYSFLPFCLHRSEVKHEGLKSISPSGSFEAVFSNKPLEQLIPCIIDICCLVNPN